MVRNVPILAISISFSFQNEYMKIKESVLRMLDCNKGYGAIMLATGSSFSAVREWVKSNKDDLTKAVVLKAISNFTGLPQEEILEEESTAA